MVKDLLIERNGYICKHPDRNIYVQFLDTGEWGWTNDLYRATILEDKESNYVTSLESDIIRIPIKTKLLVKLG